MGDILTRAGVGAAMTEAIKSLKAQLRKKQEEGKLLDAEIEIGPKVGDDEDATHGISIRLHPDLRDTSITVILSDGQRIEVNR